MLITLKSLKTQLPVHEIVLHSYEGSLYNASVSINNNTYYITDDKNTVIKARSIVEMQRKLAVLQYDNMVLKQQSAYDEMIGLATEYGQNSLEVNIDTNPLY